MIRRAARPAAGGLAELQLLGLAGSPEWWFAGLCAQTDPELFFPEKGGSTRQAKQVCAACPVRAQCLEYALAHDECFGVWGGLSAWERRPLRRGGADLGGAQLGELVDEVTVTRLMAGEQVAGATRAEAAAAAVLLHRSGQGGPKWIARRLGEHQRQVYRWIARHEAGEQLVRQGADRTRSTARAVGAP